MFNILVVAAVISLNGTCYSPPTPKELPKEIKQVEAMEDLTIVKYPFVIKSEPEKIITIIPGKSNADIEAERVAKEEADKLEAERITNEQIEQARIDRVKADSIRVKSSKVRTSSYRPATTNIQKTNGGIQYLYPDSTNNCVTYAINKLGIHRPIGNGGRNGIQGREPRVGSIGVLSSYVHAVYVESIDGNMVTFSESNYVKNYITRRSLPMSSFMGFIYR